MLRIAGGVQAKPDFAHRRRGHPSLGRCSILRGVDELSNEEIAEVTGESVATIKSRLHRARMALREILTRSLRSSPVSRPEGSASW
jgi:hypothetical protein